MMIVLLAVHVSIFNTKPTDRHEHVRMDVSNVIQTRNVIREIFFSKVIRHKNIQAMHQ